MLSIWGIILVVIGHSGFTSPEIADRLSRLHRWIYSFHMPLFFFISGYLYSLTNKSFANINIFRFLKKKWHRLLIPYIILGIVIFIIKYSFAGLSTVERSFSLNSFLYMFITPQSANSTMGFLWYLITLFLIFTIMVIFSCMRIDLKRYKSSLLIMAISWYLCSLFPDVHIFNISGMLWYIPFFITGIIFQMHRKIILKPTAQIGGGMLIISMLVFMLVLWLSNCHISVYARIIRITTALLGICASLLFCQFLLSSKFVENYILPFSGDTYSIYLLSWFGQYPIQILAINILHLNWALSFGLIFLGGVLFPILIRRIVKHIPILYNTKIITLTIGY